MSHESKYNSIVNCPTCGGSATYKWVGLDLVENSGDETLASKQYTAVQEQDYKHLLAASDLLANEVLLMGAKNKSLLEALNKAEELLAKYAPDAADQYTDEERQEFSQVFDIINNAKQ